MFDVLAANPPATALAPGIRPRQNRLRSVFLDPREREMLPDWEQSIGGMVASFRASIGTDVDDPRIAQLVGELSLVGALELRREKLPIGDSGGQLLVIYHAEPGSPSARALARLLPAAEAQERAASSR
jgi:hypothetical protein